MEERIVTHYSEAGDMTFIMLEKYENGELVSERVTGFYYGRPDPFATEKFNGKLEAEFPSFELPF